MPRNCPSLNSFKIKGSFTSFLVCDDWSRIQLSNESTHTCSMCPGPCFFNLKFHFNFWGECITTSTFLINRLPSPVLKFKSPYEILFGKVPDYQALKIFGCLCYASSLPAHRHKFAARVIPTIFMGYPIDYKGYRLLNLETREFFISRDVVFHEDIFPFAVGLNNTTTSNLAMSLVLPIPQYDFPFDIPYPQQAPAPPEPAAPINPTPNPPRPTIKALFSTQQTSAYLSEY